MAELKYWVWMNELGINLVTAHRVISYLGGPKEAFFAERDDFARVPDITLRDLEALCNKQLNSVYRIQDDMQAIGGRILTRQDAEYPQRLRDIPDAPLALYVRGRLPVVDDEAVIAIVGTRRCSPYGMKASAKIAGEIARHGGVVVTGLAAGIDGAAAEGALREGGPVIGVLGTGVERVYPPNHKDLFDAVLENGALVSEYPPGAEPLGHHFPRRNRIITGLSLALVVLEIPTAKSGAMHSVDHALEQGRDIFVVPANIDAPTSKASNELIDDGFQSASTGWRVLRDYTRQFPKLTQTEKKETGANVNKPLEKAVVSVEKEQRSTKKVIDKPEKDSYIDLQEKLKGKSEAERAVAACLCEEPIHVDDIIAQCQLSAQQVNACLTTLEITGIIRGYAGKRYSLNV
ncbi:MAG: DNA-processing protein DprA [Oscillospiraceae bacterium]|nr:DNA-processing protein DprA [Oscillospiraceae bacterium]